MQDETAVPIKKPSSSFDLTISSIRSKDILIRVRNSEHAKEPFPVKIRFGKGSKTLTDAEVAKAHKEFLLATAGLMDAKNRGVIDESSLVLRLAPIKIAAYKPIYRLPASRNTHPPIAQSISKKIYF